VVPELPPLLVLVVDKLSTLFNASSAICFVLFMRKLAGYLNRRDLVGRATRTLVVIVVTAILYIGATTLVAIDPQSVEGGGGPIPVDKLILVSGLLTLVSLIMYANTIT